MGVRKLYSALFAFSIFATTAQAQNPFEYRLEKLGALSDPAGCEDAVKAAAMKFKEQSGITPFASGCRADSLDRAFLEGVISYFASERIKNITSDDRRASVDPEGGFSSMETCEAALPKRVEQFETIFNTEPMAAWCFRQYTMSRVFVARIEAIGDSEIKSVITGFDFYGRPTIEAPLILKNLKDAAALKFPGRVVDASMESRLAYIRTTIRYYNDTRYFLDNMVEMKFKTADVCHETLTSIEGMFSTLSEKPAALFCSADGLAGIRVNLVTFSKLIGEPELYKHYQAPGVFADRAECQLQAAQIAADNDAVLGTVCTDMTPSVLHILLKKDR